MGLIHIKERGGDESYRFKKALKMAKYAIDEICELSDEMEDEFGSEGEERYGMRSGYSRRGGYYNRDEMSMEMPERRSRDSRGRYM